MTDDVKAFFDLAAQKARGVLDRMTATTKPAATAQSGGFLSLQDLAQIEDLIDDTIPDLEDLKRVYYTDYRRRQDIDDRIERLKRCSRALEQIRLRHS